MEPVVQNIFFNISLYLSIKKCVENENYIEEEENEGSKDIFQQVSGIFDMVVKSEPVQNKTVWQSFFGMFSPLHEDEETKNFPLLDSKIDTTSPFLCETVILATQQESIYAQILVQWIIAFLVLLFLWFLSCFMLCCMWKRTCKDRKTVNKKYKGLKSFRTGKLIADDLNTSCSNLSEVESVKSEFDITFQKDMKPVKLISDKNVKHAHSNFLKKTKTDAFLEQTVDKFLSELDKNIGIGTSLQEENPNFLSSVYNKNISGSSTSLVSSFDAPWSSGRSTSLLKRRARQNITSYPIGSEIQFDNCQLLWYEVETMKQKMKWSYKHYRPEVGDISDPELRIVLQAFQFSCAISPEQFTSSIFIVNYVMLLIEKELSVLVSENGFRFVRFELIGSIRKETKIGKANSFDFLMLLNCTKCSLDVAYHHGVCEDISPGNFLITAHDVKSHVHGKTFLRKAFLDENIHQLFIPSDTMVNASELIDRALNNIMNRNKKIMDRIPFTVSRTSDPGLTLILNTRLLHGLGFGIPEIYIKLTPGIPLHFDNSLMLPNIYAIVPPHLHKVKHKVFHQSDNLDIDFFWNLSFCDLEYKYLTDWLNKFEEVGIQSCFHVCLESLKNLFSINSSTALLNRGEIKSYYLETIMYFLMLESTPSNWTFEDLPSRLSDAIHFLRSAVQRQWLPNFFIGNPHLFQKSPIIMNMPLLNSNRQVNLFANMSAETSKKTLLFIESRLVETGIISCLKDEYSSDMWEYEFFVFG